MLFGRLVFSLCRWLPPSVLRGLLSVSSPREHQRRSGSERSLPLLQVVGEASCVSPKLLPQEDRNLIAQAEQEEREEQQEEEKETEEERRKSEVFSRVCQDSVVSSPFSYGTDSLSGEKEEEQRNEEMIILLKARTCRRVDGLDMQLYAHALQLLRDTLH